MRTARSSWATFLRVGVDGGALSSAAASVHGKLALDHGVGAVKKDIAALDPIFTAYAAGREPGEHFGDFTIRAGFVAKTGNGADFHANTGARQPSVAA